MQLTSLTLRSCKLGLQHLADVGELTGLLQLELPGNSFVAEQQQVEGLAAAVLGANASPAAAAAAAAAGTTNEAMEDSLRVPAAAAAEDSSRQLSSWLAKLWQLRTLDLSECRLQQGLLDLLPDLTTLTRLQLRRTCLDVTDPDAASADGATTRLQRLVLGSEGEEQQRVGYSQHMLALGAEAAASCAIVGRMQQLIELDVSHIANACEQLCAGATAAAGLRDLRSINFAYTGCTEQQLQQLMVCCPNLQTINATGNEDLCSNGGCDI
jgi:hypothetical protein